jgi:methylated-DNA-[protein]-cysteine S-methyltransferase
LTIRVNSEAVTGVDFDGGDSFATVVAEAKQAEQGLLNEAIRQLDEYFVGARRVFDLPLLLHGTDFQRRVWQALLTIPYGETKSYRDIAELVGCPRGYRAVGMANNRNPIAIIVPCHRVIGADGAMVGYGSGVWRKEYLLGLENYAIVTPTGQWSEPCTSL